MNCAGRVTLPEGWLRDRPSFGAGERKDAARRLKIGLESHCGAAAPSGRRRVLWDTGGDVNELISRIKLFIQRVACEVATS